MKQIPLLILATALGAGVCGLNAQTQPAPVPAAADAAMTPAATNAAPPPAAPEAPAVPPLPVPAAAQPAVAETPAPPVAPELPPLPPVEAGPNSLRLNFRGVSLDVVLNYLSEAAGFIIVLEAQPRGKVDVWSNTPLTREETVDLLNSVLNRNGYAAIRKGRTLTIVNKDEAKTKSIPVKLGSDPAEIPDTDEMVTQIIPVRYVEVAQLLKDLQPLVSPQTAITANESGNSIVITDTQSNIRRVAEIIKAIDMGAEDVTIVRVFRLQNAEPQETADLLTSLFPDDSRSGSGASSPIQFGGGGGRGGGFARMFGGGGNNQGSNGQNQRIKKRSRVLAVPDARTSSIIVSAAKDLMDQIEGVVAELDANAARKQNVRVFKLDNADPQQAMQVLQDIFQKSGTQTSRSGSSQNSALQSRSQQSQTSTTTSTGRTGTTRSTGSNRSSGISGFGN